MDLNTAAAVIKFFSRLELESAELYEKWSKLNINCRHLFEKLVRENRKNDQNIKKTYYGVVSDVLETGFCFKGLHSNLVMPDFRFEATPSEILEVAIRLESEIRNLYLEAAHLCKSFLADVPREMQKVAKTRVERISELKQQLEKIT